MEKAAEVVEKLTRPLVTITFTLTLSLGFLNGKVPSEAYLPIAGLIMGWWFQQRQADKDAATTKAADTIVRQINEKDPSRKTKVL